MNCPAQYTHSTRTADFCCLSTLENIKHLFHSCLIQPWFTFAEEHSKSSRIHQETKRYSTTW